jgi:hypothetical protein
VDVVPGAAGAFEVDEGSESNLSDLEDLIAAVHGPAEGWTDRVGQVADLDQMTRMWAVEKYIGHWDGYAGGINNFYLHSDDAGLFSMLPWGTDQTWMSRLPYGTDFTRGKLFIRCLADPACEAMYRTALDSVRAIIAGLDLEERVESTASVLAPWQLIDPRREYSLAKIEAAVAGVSQFLQVRPLDDAWRASSAGGGSGGSDAADLGPSSLALPEPAPPGAPPLIVQQETPDGRRAPSLQTLVQRQGIRGLANGFSHIYSSDQAGLASEEVLVPARGSAGGARSTARRAVVVARGVKRFGGPGRARIYVRPTKAFAKTLRGRRAVTVVVRLRFDPVGSRAATVRSSRVRLSRPS